MFMENGPKGPGRPGSILEVAGRLGIGQSDIIPYGELTGKVRWNFLRDNPRARQGRLILITAMSPNPEGAGKTTVTIGLAASLRLLGKNASASIRQPSLGPFFGAKGGATGSGLASVLPKEDIAFQFTGDDYAVVTSHNLISSIIDNHIYHGNPLGIDKDKIFWNRVSTVNDRALRNVIVAPGGRFERREEFHISAASEIMSILCVSSDLPDLKRRLPEMLLGLDKSGAGVKLKDLNIEGAVSALLRNAISPNLAQSAEGAPVFVHGGPFGNISIGCSSLISIRTALALSDYVLTEAGFSTELGAEKFFDILCRAGNLRPSCAGIIATLRALRYHGGANDYRKSDPKASMAGLGNLKRHIENIKKFGIEPVVILNRFADDNEDDIETALSAIRGFGVAAVQADVRDKGGAGGLEAAQALINACENNNGFRYLYDTTMPVIDKINKISREMYGAQEASLTEEARKDLEMIERLGYGGFPVCMAKTPKSVSDDPALLGAPEGFTVKVHRLKVAAGAGYIVANCGKILLMPGLPEHPLAEGIGLTDDGGVIIP